MSVNAVAISGNLTRDAELRETRNGGAVLSFSVAVNERRKNNQTGEYEDYPNYVDCTLFGKRAQSLERYLAKGTKVFVQGKLRQERWQSNGENRSKIAVIVDEIEFGNAPQNGQNRGQNGYQNRGGSQQRQQQQADAYGDDGYAYSDIPF